MGPKLKAQEVHFKAPLDIPLLLNGNFGEIRSNHFHTGLDFKTRGETGLPVYSIEAGYVSRISVSASGYGNALYVNHPSGHTSVYGHLEQFSPAIQQWVKMNQYRLKQFEVNLTPAETQFRVKKGELIGKSGNSGSSAGPHLHFEIRKTSNQHPLNPLFFGFDIQDETKPGIENLYIYPLSDSSHVQNKTSRQTFKLVHYADAYHLKGMQSVNVFGNIGFGIDAIDYLDGSWSKCGIYQMELWVDNQLINAFELDELDFDTNRYLNSHIDYDFFIRENRKIHKTFIEPGNRLKIYRQTINQGMVQFNDGKRHKVQIIVYDASMNASEISFYALSTIPVKHAKPASDVHFRYNESNRFENDQLKVNIPEGALYNDMYFEYKAGNQPPTAFSPLYKIHAIFTPLHKNIEISIRANTLPKHLESKALLAKFDIQTGKMASLGGQFEKGWVSTSSRSFGNICIVADTLAPVIMPLSIKNGNTLSEAGKIRFRISDELSGIKSYNGFIDNKWVLFEFDAKRDLLEYNFDENIKKDKNHQLKLEVEDQKGNVATYEATFYY
ncbi:MAG: M23 family metallopeptidase [Prolixibacteraceae bacterium]|nr:M23 family metallopeptidase [Prolixibacteraceae bacterium]